MTNAVAAIGWRAHAALTRSAGRSTALPAFAGTAWRLAAGELIWVGAGSTQHPRAVELDRPAPEALPVDALQFDGVAPWRLVPLALDRAGTDALRDGCVALARDIRRVGAPQGFAAMLAGLRPSFPLDRAAPQVAALARALDGDDADAGCAAALPLLGLGPGLTPSGDDFVGAMLYARRLRGRVWSRGPTPQWEAAAQSLIDAAQVRTHAIGAALFRDLAEGESFAALHRLAARLAAGEQAAGAASDVAAIGHSSGWDMLAGFVVGAAGSLVLQ